MRIKPVYNWTVSSEPADPLVTKHERLARKEIVVKGKTNKRYKVSVEPNITKHSVMASVISCQHIGSSKRTMEEAETLLSMALSKL